MLDFGALPSEVEGDEPFFAPRVLEHVQLEGVFERPVSNAANITFVKRDGVWLVGADVRDGAYGAAQTRPWFGRPIDVAVDDHLVVVTDLAAEVDAARLLARVRGDLLHVTSTLGRDADLPVLIDARSNGVATPKAPVGDDEASAVMRTVFEYDENEKEVARAGAVVQLNPSQIARLVDDRVLMRHELTHLALERFNGRVPLRASEGLANYVGFFPGTLTGAQMPAGLRKKILALPVELPLSSTFFGTDPSVSYLFSEAVVQVLVDDSGMERFLALLRRHLRVADAEPWADSVTPRALRELYGVTPEDVARVARGVIASTNGGS